MTIKELIVSGMTKEEIGDLNGHFLLFHKSVWLQQFIKNFPYDANRKEVWRLALSHFEFHGTMLGHYVMTAKSHEQFVHEMACAAILQACKEISDEYD